MVNYFLFGEVISLICGCGGMADAADSKSAGFTIVWVQVPPSAVEKERSQGNPETFSFSEAKTRLVPTVQVLRFASVVPEPTSPGRRGFSPAGSVSPRTDVPRTSWDPPSANVRAFLFSEADGVLSPMFKVVFVSLPSAQNQGPTNLFIDTVHMKC